MYSRHEPGNPAHLFYAPNSQTPTQHNKQDPQTREFKRNRWLTNVDANNKGARTRCGTNMTTTTTRGRYAEQCGE